MTADDLRAAVGAGIVTEAQAARLAALADTRAGRRATLSADDEPFELFKGFNEILMALGVALLGMALLGLALPLLDEGAGFSLIALLAMALCWLLGEWLTRRRRMALPSILLATGFALGAAGAMLWPLMALSGESLMGRALGPALCAMAAALGGLIFFRRFGLPFALFVTAGMAVLSAFILLFDIDETMMTAALEAGPAALFDARQTWLFAALSLAAGLACFALAMRYDLRDPHRVTRDSRNGFWLHLLAAPLIVNTVAMTAWNLGGALGAALLAGALALFAALALIVDRRSFLMAGLAYLALLLSAALGEGEMGDALTMLALALFIIPLAAWWTQARGALLSALPRFPGKDRLSPWTDPT